MRPRGLWQRLDGVSGGATMGSVAESQRAGFGRYAHTPLRIFPGAGYTVSAVAGFQVSLIVKILIF